jgi:hypothetical protein
LFADFALDTAVEFLLWSNIEEVLGITCANIPLIMSYFTSHKRKSDAEITRKTVNADRVMSKRPGGVLGMNSSTGAGEAFGRNTYVPLQDLKSFKEVDESMEALGNAGKNGRRESQGGIRVDTDVEQRFEVFHQV